MAARTKKQAAAKTRPEKPADQSQPVRWDVEEASTRFRVQPNTIRDWIRRGLPTVQKGGKGAGNKSLVDPLEALPWFLDHVGEDAEKIRLAREQADKVALDNAERRADLARVSVMTQAFSDAVVTAQSLLLAIPTKEARTIAAMNDANAIEHRLRTSIHDALRQLAAYGDGGAKKRKRGGRARDAAVRSSTRPDRQPVG